MVFHMKTTLAINDVAMRAVKQEAARRGTTMSELVETALMTFLRPAGRQRALPPLPEYHSGGARVDIADRNRLYEVMGT
jgi:hypothetical protein